MTMALKGTMTQEHLTEELLDRLLSSSNVREFLAAEYPGCPSFADYLWALLNAREMKRSDLARESGWQEPPRPRPCHHALHRFELRSA